MPTPMINMISGGLHAGGNLDFQDFLIMPVGGGSLAAGLEWSVRVYRRLGELLAEGRLRGAARRRRRRLRPAAVDERGGGGFRDPGDRAAGLEPGRDVALAIDVASTHFYDDGAYRLSATGEAAADRATS